MTDQRFDRETGFTLAEFKAVGDKPTGEFEAIVSVFGNVDLGGDRIAPGAFTKSLAKWQESGDPIPVIWNHMWEAPEAHIGMVAPDDASETDGGLHVKGRIDLDNPFAAQVFRLLSQRRVKEFSFGYNVVDSKRDKDGVNELRELDVIEVGPTLKGMNPATELLAVKALAAATLATGKPDVTLSDAVTAVDRADVETKAGARFSKETLARLARMRDELDEMIAAGSPDPADETPKSDEAETNGKASDPDADIRIKLQLLKENANAVR